MVMFLSRVRRFFLLLPVVYILSLVGIAVARSQVRHSVMNGVALRQTSELEDSSNQSKSSNVHLQQFERVEFKGGVPVWSVKANDARYFPGEAVTIVNQPTLRIYRNKEDDVVLMGDVARLSIMGSTLLDARMDGNVSGDLGDGIHFTTTQGSYQVKDRIFTTKEPMSVQGSGFEVSGDGFVFHIDSGLMEFLSKVNSKFQPGASAPKGFGAAKGLLSAAKVGEKPAQAMASVKDRQSVNKSSGRE